MGELVTDHSLVGRPGRGSEAVGAAPVLANSARTGPPSQQQALDRRESNPRSPASDKRLARGALTSLATFDLVYGTRALPGDLTSGIMLADLANLDNSAGSAVHDPQWHVMRRASLLDDFRRLRDLLG